MYVEKNPYKLPNGELNPDMEGTLPKQVKELGTTNVFYVARNQVNYY